MSKALEDLKAAFAGESQANRRYLAFAKKADEDGFPQVARLFRAAAHAETIHALAHFRAMDGVQTTAENLKAAIAGENYEATVMYPDFLKDAEAEDHKRAISSFKKAWEVEKVHETLYKEALASLDKPQEMIDLWVCPVCGYVEKGSAPERCPVCGAPAARFEKID